MTIVTRPPPRALDLDVAALDRLMPMHLRLDADGAIRSMGPTLQKLLPGASVIGLPVGEVFALVRPALPTNLGSLAARAGTRIHLELLGEDLVLRGLAVALNDDGMLINLSLGIWVSEAVRRFQLTVADFAATDLAVEMLYLVEAKSAVMEELRSLNLRLHGAKIAAEEQALTDTLTGLRNRRALDLRLEAVLGHGMSFGLMHIDLDYFKQVNDSLGHAAGDHVLREAARILREETRATDLVARVGGDEFVLLFPGLAEEAQLIQIAERIIAHLGQPIPFEGEMCRISGSIGMTVSAGRPGLLADDLHAEADAALYASKRAGRSRATLYDPQVQAIDLEGKGGSP